MCFHRLFVRNKKEVSLVTNLNPRDIKKNSDTAFGLLDHAEWWKTENEGKHWNNRLSDM